MRVEEVKEPAVARLHIEARETLQLAQVDWAEKHGLREVLLQVARTLRANGSGNAHAAAQSNAAPFIRHAKKMQWSTPRR